MDGIDAWTLAAAAPAMILAGASKGGFAGAGVVAATPMLALALSPEQALGVMLPLLMAMDLVTLAAYWRRWSVPDARALAAGAAVGVAVGWAAFEAIPPELTKLVIGLLALGFVAFRLAQTRGWSPPGDAAFRPGRSAGWGAVAGLTSFVAHAGGPPTAMALIPRGLDKTAYQATTVILFAWINAIKLGPYLALGLVDTANLGLSAALLPAAALGVALGVIGHRRVPQAWFDAVVLVALVVTGAKLAYDGATALF